MFVELPQGWSGHYASASEIGHGSVLQRDCSPGFLAGSLPHASEWVAGQNLADPTSWNSSALQTLKQLHGNLLTHYNCTEWAPPLADDAPATDAPAQGHDDVLALFPFLHLTFSLLCVFCRMRTMAKLLLVCRYLHNVRSQSTSCKRGRCMSRCCKIRLRTACVMYTCFILPNPCPCLMRPLPCMAICRNTTTRRVVSNHVSLSPLLCQCGARWAVHGRQSAEVRHAPQRQSRRLTMLPSFINSSGSPTTLPSLLLRMCHAAARGTSRHGW